MRWDFLAVGALLPSGVTECHVLGHWEVQLRHHGDIILCRQIIAEASIGLKRVQGATLFTNYLSPPLGYKKEERPELEGHDAQLIYDLVIFLTFMVLCNLRTKPLQIIHLSNLIIIIKTKMIIWVKYKLQLTCINN
ncbi:hypothetical protein ACJX0J_038085 [Zea mays]